MMENVQVTVPLGLGLASCPSTDAIPNVNRRYLRYFLENASKAMVVDTQTNPLSYPLVKYLVDCPSLVHAVQSVGAAHEHFFKESKLVPSLEERSRALVSIRKDLISSCSRACVSLMTVLILGISTAYLSDKYTDFGREHLLGARVLVNLVLKNQSAQEDQGLVHFIIGAYLYWEMACAFLLHSAEQSQFNHNLLKSYVQHAGERSHAFYGYSTKLVYLLGNLSRYCRSIFDGAQRDTASELLFETQLLEFQFMDHGSEAQIMGQAFRNHGLITLYRLAGRTKLSLGGTVIPDEEHQCETNGVIYSYALNTIDLVLGVPLSSPHLGSQGTPLLTAAAELKAPDKNKREQVNHRFKALFSLTRFPVYLGCLELLEEIWNLNDQGCSISWLDLMMAKGWNLRIS